MKRILFILLMLMLLSPWLLFSQKVLTVNGKVAVIGSKVAIKTHPITSLKYVQFNGTDEKITWTAQTYAGAFSFNMWIYPTSVAGTIMGRTASATDYYRFTGTTSLYVKINNVGSTITLSSAFNNSSWQMITITRNTSNLVTIYRNMVAVGTVTASGSHVLSQVAAVSASSFYYGGKMDEVAVWNKELSAAERTTLYGDGNISVQRCGKATEVSSGLQIYYDFEAVTSMPTITDVSGNGINGTAVNMDASNIISY